jgi:NAD(P)-dependent dehydrogenase (short-subunit alcohol dehydrogenase family)
MAHTPGTMDFDNLMFENGGHSPFAAYARSKLANLMFAYELQRRIDKHKLTVKSLAAHPGGAKTGLFRHVNKNIFTYLFSPFFFLFTQSAYRGSLSGIRAALDENAKGGEFYGPQFYMIGPPVKVRSNSKSYNKEIAEKLWDVSEKLTGVKFDT